MDPTKKLLYVFLKSCEERESLLLIENNQIINLTSASRSAECQVIRLDQDKAKYRCVGNRTFRSSRERWWFIAVSNCPSSKVTSSNNSKSIIVTIIQIHRWQGLSLKYRFWMTNGPSDDVWFQQFSADEFCKHIFKIIQTDRYKLPI